MKIQDIDNAIENNQCPVPMFCTVATTCYEENERRDICLSCWMKTMKERNIEVLYDEEE